MREMLFTNKDIEVEACCHNLDIGVVGLEIEDKWVDGTALIDFESPEAMIKFARSVHEFALKVQGERDLAAIMDRATELCPRKWREEYREEGDS